VSSDNCSVEVSAVKWRQSDLLLLALNVVALTVGAVWGVGRLRADSATVVAPVPSKAVPARTMRNTDVQTAQIEAAPLFASNRLPQPEPSASPPAVAVAAARPAPSLRGIVSVEGLLAAALEASDGSRRKLVFAGQEYDGWTVNDISARGVRLNSGATSVELSLRAPAAATPAASAPVPPAKP
jgi:hypothetical protein